jgi:RNA polymerase sigma factor (sigma-70 family)
MHKAVAASARESVLPEDQLKFGIHYAQRIAREFCQGKPAVDPAQVSSFAVEGALIAWRTFDPTKGSKWTTFLYNQVRYSILKGIRPTKERSHNAFHQQYQVVSLDDGTSRKPHAWGSGDATNHEVEAPETMPHFEDRSEMLAIVFQLPQDERWVITQRFFLDRTCQDIAQQLGVSAMTIWRKEKKGLATLRSLMTVSGPTN